MDGIPALPVGDRVDLSHENDYWPFSLDRHKMA